MKRKNTHIIEEDFRRYLENQMSEAERNRFERELQKNPFEADAMEGYEMTSVDLKNDLEEIKSRIAGRKRKNTYRYWAAAATVLLLITAGLIWYQLGNEPPTPEMAALENEELFEESPTITDSVEKRAVSKPEEIIEPEPVETAGKKNEQFAAEESQSNKKPVAKNVLVKQPAETKSKIAEEEVLQQAQKEETVRDTKKVNFNFASDQNRVSSAAQRNSLRGNRKNSKLVLTEKAALQVDDDDIFPDSFKTIPAKKRDRVQEIQGVAIQDQVEMETDAVLPDMQAYPEGGMKKYMNYLEKNAELPSDYLKNGVPVRLSIAINSNGNIIGFTNKNNADSALFKHSKKIIKNGPKWNPKVVNGEQIQSEVELNIVFQKKEINK